MRYAAAAAVAAVVLATWVLLRSEQRHDRPAVVWIYFQPDSTRSPGNTAFREGDAILEDLPLPAGLVARVAAAGATVREESRWLRAVSVEASPSILRRISEWPSVMAIRAVGRVRIAGATGTASAVGRATSPDGAAPAAAVEAPRATARAAAPVQQAQDSTYFGPNWRTMRDMGIPVAQVEGYRGTAIRVAILDTGFDLGHESLSTRTVVATRDFVNGDTNVDDQPGDPPGQTRHGTRVWSILGAFRPGTMVGAAPDAEFILAKVKSEPALSTADEDRWVAGVEWAESLGARVIVSALYFRTGFTDRPDIPYGALNGDSTVTTRIADQAARRGVLVVNAIGDLGPNPGTLAAPADADSVLSVGAVDATGQPARFGLAAGTSRGPTADGRIKPEVVARGTSMFAASSTSPAAYDIGLEGTSYATALVGGVAVLFTQAWPELSAAAARRAITLAGSQAGAPDNAIGAGVPDVASAILFPEGIRTVSIATVDANRTITTLAPTFTWSVAPGPRGFGSLLYRLEVATDPEFANIVFSDTVRDALSLTAHTPIRPASPLYWRAVGTAPTVGLARAGFASGAFSVPDWVRLVAPDPGVVSFVNTPRPTMRWTPLTAPPPIGPLTYDVEILSNETGRPVQPAQLNLTTASVQVANPLVPNTAYRWRVIVHTQPGAVDTVESVNPFVVTSETLPPATLLYQNFPNPFPQPGLGTTATRVWFDLSEMSSVELVVLDLGGRLVKRLIPADASCGTVTLQAGIYGREGPFGTTDPCVATTWDGTDSRGREVARGVYILRLTSNGRDLYRRMLFLPGG